MAATYILPIDLPTFYDKRRVLDLLSDDETTPADDSALTGTGTDGYKIAINAIQTGAAMLDAHCQMGKRYTRDTLEGIIADAIANPADVPMQKRAALIRQTVADLAFGCLMSRRGYTGDKMREMAPRYDEALLLLEKLAAGLLVFDLDANINAGVPVSVLIGKNTYRPSAANKMFGIWSDQPYVQNNQQYFLGGW